MERYDQASAGGSGGEIVLGLVAPVGTDLAGVVKVITERAERSFSYRSTEIRLSELLKNFFPGERGDEPTSHAERMHRKMDLGNMLRAQHTRSDALALAAILKIREERSDGQGSSDAPRARSLIVLNQLKRPEEVRKLREIYGPSFFLIGVVASYEERRRYLAQEFEMTREEAEGLIERDEGEDREHGQQMRKTFQLADVFVPVDRLKPPIWRFLDLIFGHPYRTPTREEHAMFMAFAASTRSADLSRQVGAVVVNANGDLLGSGANDVPSAGGGQYWPDDNPFGAPEGRQDQRDWARGYDSNVKQREKILLEIAKATGLMEGAATDAELIDAARVRLKQTSLFDLTEFGRAVHAEVAALMSCARIGASPQGASLYCTTFPCHNCTKHIVASGIKEVIYIEPYPKSKALELHGDSIHHVETQKSRSDGAIHFRPFIGLAPRSFADLFSMSGGQGRPLIRKDRTTGETVNFWPQHAHPRLSVPATSYLEREQAAIRLLHQHTHDLDLEGGNDETEEE